MEYFDFLKPGELEDLPEDPKQRFVGIVRLAEPRLKARLEELDDNYEQHAHLIEDARYGFQNLVFSAAKGLGIEPFASQEMPTLHEYNPMMYRQFRQDLTAYIMQIMIHAADQDRSDSVPLTTKITDSIRSRIALLREAIDKADLSDAKKAALHARLDTVEEELTRRRVRYLLIARVMIELLAAPGALWQSYQLGTGVITSILKDLGEAKVADNENRQLPVSEPIVLLAPRSPEEQNKVSKPTKRRSEFVDLDDEIPF